MDLLESDFENVVSKLFDDENNPAYMTARRLVKKIAPYIGIDSVELEQLQTILDPNCNNPHVNQDTVKAALLQWYGDIQNQKDLCLIEEISLVSGSNDSLQYTSFSNMPTNGHRERITELQNELADKEYLVKNLKKKLEHSTQVIQQHEDTLTQLTLEKDKLVNKLVLVQNSSILCETLKKEYAEQLECLNIFKEKCLSLECEIDKLKKDNTLLNVKIIKNENEKIALTQCITLAKEDKENVQKQLAESTVNLDLLLSENVAFREKISEQKQTIDVLYSIRHSLEVDLQNSINKSVHLSQYMENHEECLDDSIAEDLDTQLKNKLKDNSRKLTRRHSESSLWDESLNESNQENCVTSTPNNNLTLLEELHQVLYPCSAVEHSAIDRPVPCEAESTSDNHNSVKLTTCDVATDVPDIDASFTTYEQTYLVQQIKVLLEKETQTDTGVALKGALVPTRNVENNSVVCVHSSWIKTTLKKLCAGIVDKFLVLGTYVCITYACLHLYNTLRYCHSVRHGTDVHIYPSEWITLQEIIESIFESPVELKCQISRAPYILRPFGGLYNPFSFGCSILCNHPADADIKDVVKRAKDARVTDNKELLAEEMAALEASLRRSEKHVTHEPTVDFVPEELFRRYTQTDSRPLTPAPTLASAVSRGSLRRRCLTPDQPPAPKKTLVLDLRRSHSQETLYWHGYQTSDISSGLGLSSLGVSRQTPATSSPTKLTVASFEGQLPPLVSQATLLRRSPYLRGTVMDRGNKLQKNQIKALQTKHLMQIKSKAATDEPEKSEEGTEDEHHIENMGEEKEMLDVDTEIRRRGRRKKGRHRATSAILLSSNQNDPETQIAGIGSESHNPSSRASVAQAEDIVSRIPSATLDKKKKSIVVDSFLDQNILKHLQRDVDNLTIESEFNPKRKIIYEEAMRTRQKREHGKDMNNLLNEINLSPLSLDKWLHTPRVFSRKNATFSLPIDRRELVGLSPMQYVANYVNVSTSKFLLYHTVLEKLNPGSYSMPLKCVSEGLKIMMGETLTDEMVQKYQSLLDWESYTQEDIDKLYNKKIFVDDEFNQDLTTVDDDEEIDLFAEIDIEPDQKEVMNDETVFINFRLWCSICGLCERLYGSLPSVKRDPPHEIEVADFDTLQGKLITQKVDENLCFILTQIQLSHGHPLYK